MHTNHAAKHREEIIFSDDEAKARYLAERRLIKVIAIAPARWHQWPMTVLLVYGVIFCVGLFMAWGAYNIADYYWITGPRLSDARIEREQREIFIELDNHRGYDATWLITTMIHDGGLVEHKPGQFVTSEQAWINAGDQVRSNISRDLRDYCIVKYDDASFMLKSETGVVLAFVDENLGTIAITLHGVDGEERIKVIK